MDKNSIYQIVMKISTLLLFFILFVFITFCGKIGIEENQNTIVLEVGFEGGSKTSPLTMSEVVDSVTYLPIRSDNVLIGMIGDIRYHNHRYYILDSQQNFLYVMDETGHILNSISQKGPGPTEYITLQGFDVNPSNEEISLYDNSSKRIQVYSKEGTYLRSIVVDDVIRDFAVLDNGEYLFYTPDFMKGNRRGLWRTDKEGEFKEQLVTIDDKFLYGGLYPKYFRRIDDTTVGLMGTEDFDRIYHITANSMLVKYKIKTDRVIPKDLQTEPVLDFNKHKGVIYTKNDYVETESLMSLTVTDMKKNILVFYDKNTGKCWRVTGEGDFVDDMDMYVKYQFCGNNSFIGVLYPGFILAFTGLQKQFPDITSDSNPVLVLSHVK